MSEPDPNDPGPDIMGYLYGELSEEESSAFEAQAPHPLRREAEADAAFLETLRQSNWQETPPEGLSRLALGAAARRPIPLWARLRSALLSPATGVAVMGAMSVLVFVAVSGDLLEKPDLVFGRSGARSSSPQAAVERDLAESDGTPGAPTDDQDEEAYREDLAAPRAEPSLEAEDDAPARALPRRARGPHPNPRLAEPILAPPVEAAAAESLPARRAEMPAPAAPPPPSQTKRPASGEAPAARPSVVHLPTARSASDQGRAASGESPAEGGVYAPEATALADEAVDPRSGRDATQGQALLQRALHARAQGEIHEARRALERATTRVYLLPLLGDVLLLRAQIEMDDQRYTEARTYAERAARVRGFSRRSEAAALALRAAALEPRR